MQPLASLGILCSRALCAAGYALLGQAQEMPLGVFAAAIEIEMLPPALWLSGRSLFCAPAES